MRYTLYYHPLSSYCQKVIVAFYESGVPFVPKLVDLGNPDERAGLVKLYPIAKFPVLRDEERGETIPESSVIIEYLARHHSSATPLMPAEPELAARVRAQDRFYDLYLHTDMQKIIGDRLRPADKKDPYGVEQARTRIKLCYGMIDADMADKTWAAGDTFTMADCAAAPPLFYANMVEPFEAYPNVKTYFGRLSERPSYKRALEEAKPYFHMIPK
jgi:glutathione S-transferase